MERKTYQTLIKSRGEVLKMKMKNNLTKFDDISDDLDTNVLDFEGIEENLDTKELNLKKPLIAVVLTLSIGLIAAGVSCTKQEPDTCNTYNAIEVEQTKWSDFNSTKINSYFNIISAGSEYKLLDAMCVKHSKVHSRIKANEANMQHSYDEYYGTAEGMRRFGRYMSISHINGVCDNKVSLTICCITDDDITEFFNLYANDLNRYFTSHELSEENIVRELFNLLNAYEISTSEVSIELPVKKVDGVWIIANDSEIADLLEASYNTAMQEVVKQLSLHR